VILLSHVVEPAQQPQGVYEKEPHGQKPDAASDGLGAFSRILAGLLVKPAEASEVAESQSGAGVQVALEAGQLAEPSPLSLESGSGFPALAALAPDFAETSGAGQILEFAETDISIFESLGTALSGAEAAAYPAAAVLSGYAVDQTVSMTETAGSHYLAGYAAKESAPGAQALSRETPLPQPNGEVASQRVVADESAAVKNPAGASALAEAAASAQPREFAENPRAALSPTETPAEKAADAGAAYQSASAASKPYETRDKNQRRSLVAEARELRSAEARSESASAYASESRAPSESSSGASRDIAVELRLPAQNANSSATTAWESRTMGQALEGMLARELRQNLNGDIVRQAALILRDGSEGIIRLALKPESLGNVKIHIEMAENKITGYIVVESEEALRAFEREIASLEKEFKEAGFDGAELQMSLASGGDEQQWYETDDGRFMPIRLAASRYDDAAAVVEGVPASAEWNEAGTVDLLA